MAPNNLNPSPRTISILQWNCCSIRGKLPELNKQACDFDVIILAETWLKETDGINLKDFYIIRSDRVGQTGGGTAIMIKKDIEFKRVEDINNGNGVLEYTSILVNTHMGELLILACYRPPNQNTNNRIWKNFFESVTRYNKFIVAGDLNAHDPLWGSSHSCTAGRHIKDCLEDLDLVMLNDGTSTFVSRPFGTESCLDLTFTDEETALVSEWSVSEDAWGSDHFPIKITLGVAPTLVESDLAGTRLYSPSKISWETFSCSLESKLKEEEALGEPGSSVTTRYSRFLQLTRESVLAALPQTNKTRSGASQKRKQGPVSPWWNEICEKAVQTRKEAFAKFKLSHTREDFLEFKKAEGKAKFTLKKEKKRTS